jgi:hypothetical protein
VLLCVPTRSWLIAIFSAALLTSSTAFGATVFGTGNSVTISLNWVLDGSPTTSIEPENGPQALSLDIANPSNPIFNASTPHCVTYGPANLLTIAQQPTDGVTIQIFDTQIVITNDLPDVAFCSVTAPCPSEFWAFDFKFSPAINLPGATLNAGTSSDFQPTGLGLQLLSPTEVRVQVTGDAPAQNSKLIIDLFPAATATPEPASALLLGAALGGLALVNRLRSRV